MSVNASLDNFKTELTICYLLWFKTKKLPGKFKNLKENLHALVFFRLLRHLINTKLFFNTIIVSYSIRDKIAIVIVKIYVITSFQ